MDIVEFEESEDFVINFGKHKGSSIGDVADVDIMYLVWLSEEIGKHPPAKADSPQGQLWTHLNRYISDPNVQDEIKHVKETTVNG